MLKSNLKQVLRNKIPQARENLKQWIKLNGAKVQTEVQVNQILGGMRNIKALYTDISSMDPYEGIRWRNFTIPQIQQKLPRIKESPLPEALLYLLISGDIPNNQQAQELSEELQERSQISQSTIEIINSLPKDMHAMTQLSIGVLSLQPESQFAQLYNTGKIGKLNYWEYIYEDGLNLIAKLPKIAAMIYCRKYLNKPIGSVQNKDWAGSFANLMHYNDQNFIDLLRLYMCIHSEHELGDVSPHTIHLVNSSLADPFYSFSAGLNGLAGPLHGLANQEVLKWLLGMRKQYNQELLTDQQVEDYCRETIKSGRVIPGYGHGILRVTDPRFTCQFEFAQRNCPNDPLVKLVKQCFNIIPKILKETGKVSNPYPNIDAHSGVLLNHYGLTQYDFFTVLFGVSRSLGTMSNLIWARAYGLSIERPNSTSMKEMEKL